MKKIIIFISLLFCSSFAFSVGFNVGNPGEPVVDQSLKSYVVPISFIPHIYQTRGNIYRYDLTKARNLCMGTLTPDGDYVITSSECVDEHLIPSIQRGHGKIEEYLFVSFYRNPEVNCKFWGGKCYQEEMTYQQIRNLQRTLDDTSEDPEYDLQDAPYQTLKVAAVEPYGQGIVRLKLSRKPDFMNRAIVPLYPFSFQKRKDTLQALDAMVSASYQHTSAMHFPIPLISQFEYHLFIYGNGFGRWAKDNNAPYQPLDDYQNLSLRLLQNQSKVHFYTPISLAYLEQGVKGRHFIRFILTETSLDKGDIGAPVILEGALGVKNFIGVVAVSGRLETNAGNFVAMDVALLNQ